MSTSNAIVRDATERYRKERREAGESRGAFETEIRRLGGALFCDRRFGQVFTYHNGAESYYGARGFRGCLRI